jgi:excisionase family DNA binding protein
MVRLLSVDEVSGLTAVKPSTWRAWILRRKIKTVKLGRCVRIPEEEIERLVETGTVPASEEPRARRH